MEIRIAGIVRESFVDGPGVRYVIFTQGCPHNCRGCHNLQTHDFDAGQLVNVDNIIKDILESPHIDGVTLSGGEPFMQPEAIEYLINRLKCSNINIICYTGYTFEELMKDKVRTRIVKMIDLLIDGPFVMEEKDLALKFRGSRNQRIINIPESIAAGRVKVTDLNRW